MTFTSSWCGQYLVAWKNIYQDSQNKSFSISILQLFEIWIVFSSGFWTKMNDVLYFHCGIRHLLRYTCSKVIPSSLTITLSFDNFCFLQYIVLYFQWFLSSKSRPLHGSLFVHMARAAFKTWEPFANYKLKPYYIVHWYLKAPKLHSCRSLQTARNCQVPSTTMVTLL